MKTKNKHIQSILNHHFDSRTEMKACEEIQDVYYFHIPSYISIDELEALLICYYPNKIWDFTHLADPSRRRLKVVDEKFAQHLKKHSLQLLGIEEQKVTIERPVVTYTPIVMKSPRKLLSDSFLDTFCDFTWNSWITADCVLTNKKETAIKLLALGFTYVSSSTKRASFVRGYANDFLEYVQEKKDDFFFQSLRAEEKEITLIHR